MQQFLASFGVEIDETGLRRLQEALTQNRALAESLAKAFEKAREAVQTFFQSLEETPMPTPDLGAGNITGENRKFPQIPLSLNLSKASSDLTAFVKEAGKTLKLTADPSGILTAGQTALSRLRSLYASTTLPLKTAVQNTSGITLNTLLKAATGGRFARPQQLEIAEDGDPEYVIPVKKENLAVPLLKRLIGELSPSARESLQTASLSTLNTALNTAAEIPQINQHQTTSVQAPVSINIKTAGADPEAVGRSVYNVAEQYLLRTLRSAI